MKTILITGATDGIGKQTAKLISAQGLRVIIHGRNAQKVNQTVDELKRQDIHANIEYLIADFEDFNSIDQLIDDLHKKQLKPDILLNNAGIIELNREILPNGIEKTFMVNYLASYYLTRRLMPVLLQSTNPRVINVSSMAQARTIDFDNLTGKKNFDGYESYALSKLCNVLFTYKLHRKFGDSGLKVVCLHPGMINTKLLRTGWGSGGATVELGAKHEVFAALSAEMPEFNGQYLLNSRPSKSVAISYDTRVQDRLWQISAKLTGLDEDG
ncbi:MAG: hypothetical protein A2W85_17455 [Bacteroidetes bacterium GWF2_41_31]|nr:MAG: hypothetical protein A2W85_17455 [Bacteroidetes bacterium GWF2_41_31]OFZ06596.1 MAG: hypothetical protein A2338_07850 [Bacteroidetes bacterium RIFOXYB12_FULL_41_6]